MSRITAHTASGLSKSVTADNADDRSPEPDPGTPDGALVKQALFLGTSQADSLVGGDENDQIFGDAQDDTLSGGLGDDFVSGWSGNDLLYLSQGMDTLSGGTGSDTLSAFELTEGVVITLDDSDPNSDDYGAGSYVSGTASGTFTGIEALVGTVSADTLTGGRGADILTGGLGDDVIRGGAGADRVIIAADIQSVTIYHTETGGYRVLSVDGDDLFDGIEQFDFMVGDILTASLDVLAMDLIARPAPVNGNLNPQPTISGTAESDTLTGTAAADTISGDGGDDLITGAANNDFLIGGAGNDRLDGGGGSDSLFGGLGDDTLLLSTGSDVLYGDLPLPLPPQDEGIDTLDATSAELQALLENGHDLNGNTAGIQVTFTGDGDGLVEAPTYVMVDDGTGPVPERVETLASLRGIEVVLGTVHDDTLTGHDGSETLRGGAGDDLLTAGAGDDLLDGGAGNDTLRLGEGLDTVLGGDGIDQMSGSLLEQGLVVTVTSGNTAVGSSGSFATGDAVNTFSGIEIFEGSSLADRMTGGAANETMIGGAGDDTLSGGAGTDVAVIGASFLQSSIYRTETGLRIVSDQGNDLYTGFETFAFRNVTLGLADILQVALPDPDDGSFVPVPDNYISGTNSDDTLTGTDLFDQIDGAGGNDLIRGDSGGDVLIGGSGNDTLDGQDGADTLFGGLGNDLLILSRGEDRLFGDLAVDVADAGIDTLDGGGAGLGAVLGGMGLQITFSADGDGTVIANGTSDLSPLADTISSFEGIEVVLGSANGDTITGNVGSETLRGASGDDVLSAGAGADLLDGGAGNDTLYVGSGADSLLGGAGRDMFSGAQLTGPLTLTVSQSDPQAGSYTFGTATGLFTGIEVFEGSDFGDTLTGGAGADTFLGGLGNDVIDGGAGSDVAVIGVDLLDADIYSTDSGFRIVSAQGDDRYSGIETFIFDDVSLDITDITQIAAPENDFNSPGTGSGSDTVDASPLEDVLAPVGDAITSRSDPAIASALFAQGGVTLDSIAYVGAPDAIGLLPGGYLITDGTTSVGIDNGIFLSTGGGPGWQNTTGSYSINNRTAGSDLLDQAAAEIFATAPTTNDAAVLTFTFEGHELGGLSTLSLDLFIGSDEYLGPVQGL
ncbi:choice-of-anchor L domain-containing protein, partial [Puniceibacterium confluentis]|uniref:choice-of-anchor L domain-containing protein n=1 Tax=Puniceibacterium confluentis TaxID=1958944 RepID=UPI00356B005B